MLSSFRKSRLAFACLLLMVAANCLVAQKVLQSEPQRGEKLVPDGTGNAVLVPEDSAKPTGQTVVTGNGINYHGGPVLKGNPVPIYLIWYGNWNGTGSNTAATQSLVEHFISTLGNTPYEHIATTYGDTTGNVSGNVSLGGTATVNTSTNLNDTRLRNTVNNVISSGALPRDANGVYLVLSSSNI